MDLEFEIGLDAITSYKRLAYTPWHAIAEFVDNSTQSYFNNRSELNDLFAKADDSLRVEITYSASNGGTLTISDNAMGMSLEELRKALHVASPPDYAGGRSKYGMGLKTAACWIGNLWTVTTKKLGETVEHHATIDVGVVAGGQKTLPYEAHEGLPPELHYTIIEIRQHNRRFVGRTLGKIRQFLSSMYREDFRTQILVLKWQDEELSWVELDDRLLKAQDGTTFKKKFEFLVNNEDSPKKVRGWVGILDRGSRADAGFSILHAGRVVKGWPESWRPSSLYGQIQGSNDLVNQRLVGEIHLDDFEVSHTKDDILWLGDQEEQVESGLREHCNDFKDLANQRRKGKQDQRGPTDAETKIAVDEFVKELTSPEVADYIRIEPVLPEDVVYHAITAIAESIVKIQPETFRAEIGDAIVVKGYIDKDLSPNDPYILVESSASEVIVIVNTVHPHWLQLDGSIGVLNYLRHCVYDGIAEWQARIKVGRIDPNTIKLLKDRLLRVSFEIEMHENAYDGDK